MNLCKKFRVVQSVVKVTTVCTRPGAVAKRRNIHDGLQHPKLLAEIRAFSQRERKKLRSTKGAAEMQEFIGFCNANPPPPSGGGADLTLHFTSIP